LHYRRGRLVPRFISERSYPDHRDRRSRRRLLAIRPIRSLGTVGHASRRVSTRHARVRTPQEAKNQLSTEPPPPADCWPTRTVSSPSVPIETRTAPLLPPTS